MCQRVHWINATRNSANASSCLKWWQSLTRGILEAATKVLLKLILILVISLRHHVQRRARIRSCASIFFGGLVLKIKRIVCLIVEKSLSLKEILPPLKSRLLLHLLERVAAVVAHLLLLLLVSSSGAVISILVL